MKRTHSCIYSWWEPRDRRVDAFIIFSFLSGLKAQRILLVIMKKKPPRQVSVWKLPGITVLSIPWEYLKWIPLWEMTLICTRAAWVLEAGSPSSDPTAVGGQCALSGS